MDCFVMQEVRYGTHMLAVEDDDWWLETRQRLEAAGEVITWDLFRRGFLRRYPKDVCMKKEIEFLELKHGNLSVMEYAARFVELEKLYPHYNEATAEFSKCIKFENGLCPEIKKEIGYQEIRNFPYLVDSCRIYEEDNNAHYKIINKKRGKQQQNCGKPYDAPTGKGKQKVAKGNRTSGGDAHTGIVCFKCGKSGHKSNACTGDVKMCLRRGKVEHEVADCKHKEVICLLWRRRTY
ncbi:uncharacterized protein LOC131597585 [Vicia villosa]|uniref:uncharacterized protein LOC131597585 n=1 Tax=Vicia villosa TaxID=3911 RepID=UPI00273C0C10|nr:uncharacterized protein LOC131597585 [Vicia villosa]